MKAVIFTYPSRLSARLGNAFGFATSELLPDDSVLIGEIESSGTGYVIPPTSDVNMKLQLYSTCRRALDKLNLPNHRMGEGPAIDNQPSWKPVQQKFHKASKYIRRKM